MKPCLRKCMFVVVFILTTCSAMPETSDNPATSDENKTTTTTNVITNTEIDDEKPIRKIWQEQEKGLKSFMNNVIKKNMPALMREVYSRNISSSCLSSLLQLTGALRQIKLWAFKMIDASGKFPVGFLSGTMTALGNYEECLNIDIHERRLKVRGQYCLVDVTPPLPKWRPFMSLHLPVPELINISAPDSVMTYISSFAHNLYITSIKTGLCIPSSCTKDDVDRLIQILPEAMSLTWKFSVNRCETKESFQFSPVQNAIVNTFIFILVLVLVGTLADLSLSRRTAEKNIIAAKVYQVLRCFSLRVNMKSIANYTGPHEHLRFIYGYITILMIWIIAANAFMSINYDTAANFVYAIRMTRNVWYEIMMNRIIPMQALLFFTAFAASYSWILSKEQSIWKYLFKPYWRYTPTYMILIGLLMITPGWGSGPSWMSYMSSTYTNCKSNWWANLLYINNYVNSEEMCLEHSWFFAVAAQLHFVGLIILIPLKRNPKAGLLLNLFLMLASLFTVFLTNLYYNILPNETMAFSNQRDIMYYAVRSYHRLYSHLVFYCAGVFVGYIAATKPNMKISKKMSWSLWLLSNTGALTTVCVVHVWSDGNLPSPLLCASYATFAKLLWAAFLTWSSLSCILEQKGGFHDFMSWKAYTFLNRLMFIVLVINPSIVTMILGFKRAHVFISDFEVYYNLASLIICNYIPAYAIYIVSESPLHQLTALIKNGFGATTLVTITEKGTVSSVCEAVLTEKPPKASVHRSKEKNVQEIRM